MDGDHSEESELDSRCLHSWLFRSLIARMAGQVRRASHRRPKDTSPDSEMAEGGRVRGREVVEDGSRDSARGSGYAPYAKGNLGPARLRKGHRRSIGASRRCRIEVREWNGAA